MTENELPDLADLPLYETARQERQAQVSAMLAQHEAEPEEKPNGRKRRSDAGVPRAMKQKIAMVEQDWVATSSPGRLNAAPQQPSAGSISAQQAAQLIRLAEIMCASHQKLDEARRENHQALHDYCRYVESLTITN